MGDLAFVGFYSLIIYIESIHVGLGVFFFLCVFLGACVCAVMCICGQERVRKHFI